MSSVQLSVQEHLRRSSLQWVFPPPNHTGHTNGAAFALCLKLGPVLIQVHFKSHYGLVPTLPSPSATVWYLHWSRRAKSEEGVDSTLNFKKGEKLYIMHFNYSAEPQKTGNCLTADFCNWWRTAAETVSWYNVTTYSYTSHHICSGTGTEARIIQNCLIRTICTKVGTTSRVQICR